MHNSNLYSTLLVRLKFKKSSYLKPIKNLAQKLSILLLCFIMTTSRGQNSVTKPKSIFLELGGSGGLGSINFEKQFHKKKNTNFTWRAGLSLAPIDKNNGTGLVFPLMVNTLIGGKAHKLELGIGQGITFTTKGNFFALTTANVGYRYQAEQKRWFYRVTYTPLISYLIDFQIQHWAGVSIGYTFKNSKK